MLEKNDIFTETKVQIQNIERVKLLDAIEILLKHISVLNKTNVLTNDTKKKMNYNLALNLDNIFPIGKYKVNLFNELNQL